MDLTKECQRLKNINQSLYYEMNILYRCIEKIQKEIEKNQLQIASKCDHEFEHEIVYGERSHVKCKHCGFTSS